MKRAKPLSPAKRLELAAQVEHQAIVEQASRDIVHREGVLTDLEGFRKLDIHSFFQEDDEGVPQLRKLTDIKGAAAKFIKKIKVRRTVLEKFYDGDEGNDREKTAQTVEVTTEMEFHDILKVEEMIGKFLGMWKDGNTHNHLHLNSKDLVGVPMEDLEKRLKQLEDETCREKKA